MSLIRSPLAARRWLLTAGCPPLAARRWLLAAGCSPLAARRWLLALTTSHGLLRQVRELKRLVAVHGVGQWAVILANGSFEPHRSSVDVKVWRE